MSSDARLWRQEYFLASDTMEDAIGDFACHLQDLSRRLPEAHELTRQAIELGRLVVEHRRLMSALSRLYLELERQAPPELAPVITLFSRKRTA